MIRVLIVDDHKVVRQGLRFLLEQEDGIQVVGECTDGPSAIQAVRTLEPTVVLLDLSCPAPTASACWPRSSRNGPPPRC
jgi:two-component system, NarL family, response regulator LiaR